MYIGFDYRNVTITKTLAGVLIFYFLFLYQTVELDRMNIKHLFPLFISYLQIYIIYSEH